MLVLTSLACSGGFPELTPGVFSRPTEVETQGGLTLSRYRYADGPSTVYYAIFEANGEVHRVKDGYAEYAKLCPQKSIGAASYRARGEVNVTGLFVIQVDGSRVIRKKICPYGPPGRWDGTNFHGSCGYSWDAVAKKRVKTPD